MEDGAEGFGQPSGAAIFAGSRTQSSRLLAQTPPWAIFDRSDGADGEAGGGKDQRRSFASLRMTVRKVWERFEKSDRNLTSRVP